MTFTTLETRVKRSREGKEDLNKCVGRLVGFIEDLLRLAVLQPYRDLEAGYNQSLKCKWRGGASNPRHLAPQAKS